MDKKKTCFKCLEPKTLDEFYDHPQMKDGKLNKCKECCRRAMRSVRERDESTRDRDRRRYREDPKRKAAIIARQAANPERTKLIKICSQKVMRAVAKGELKKPGACQDCGRTGVFLEAAHYNYAKPLEVRWLCRRCHRKWDAAQPKFIAVS
jgi:hypothetical protein